MNAYQQKGCCAIDSGEVRVVRSRPRLAKEKRIRNAPIHPNDAATLGCAVGDWIKLTTRRGSAQAPVEVTQDLQPGHVSLPNGHGIDYQRADGSLDRRGVSLNELTNTDDRDPIAGTPWHK